MITRKSGRELIQESVKELLQTHTIDELTVRMIADNCGISSQSFYYHFRDKHEVVASIYLDEMTPYLNSPLNIWYDRMTHFLFRERIFCRNTLCYRGQNNLIDVVFESDKEKLMRHVLPSAKASDSLYSHIILGIDYMVHGDICMVVDAVYSDELCDTMTMVYKEYPSQWDALLTYWPKVVLENLSMEPVVWVEG